MIEDSIVLDIKYGKTNLPRFSVDFEIKNEAVVLFTVYQATEWVDDEIDDVAEYLSGSIKWDGDTTLWFAPSLYLEGKFDWKAHSELMLVLYEEVTKRIEAYSPTEAEDL